MRTLWKVFKELTSFVFYEGDQFRVRVMNRAKRQFAVMLYNAAEMYDGFLGFASLGFYDGDLIRVQARRAIIDWLGSDVLTKV